MFKNKIATLFVLSIIVLTAQAMTKQALREKLNALLVQGPNAQDEDGNTPLHFAAALGEPQETQQLLEAKADATRKNRAGITPLMLVQQTIDELMGRADIKLVETLKILKRAE